MQNYPTVDISKHTLFVGKLEEHFREFRITIYKGSDPSGRGKQESSK